MKFFKKFPGFLCNITAALVALIFLAPLYFIVINTFKPFPEIMTSFASFPKTLYLDSYQRALEVLDLQTTFLNSFLVTAVSVGGNLLMSAMAAYILARTAGKKSWFLFLLYTFSILVPFQAIMIPLTQWVVKLHLGGSLVGLIFVYWGYLAPLSVFFLHGFVKGVPIEIEEAAVIDGCGRFRAFFSVVIPLMKPALSSLAALNFLYVWNDFLLPMLLVFGDKEKFTIPLAQYNLYGQFNTQWDIAVTCVFISMIPCLIFFIFMQKYLVRGINMGAVKG